MPISIQCPNLACRKVAVAPDEILGRSVRCRHCKQSFLAQGTTVDHGAETQAPESTNVKPVKTVGRFQIRKRLGAGAFGIVYRAYDPQLDREVAVKVPNPAVLADPKRFERFLREAKSAAQLRHPHIVPVFDTGKDGESFYIASAFIQGQPLSDSIDESGVEFARAGRLVRELAEALAYAHDQGIVHRDVKPDNMMLDAQDRVHLMDFGLAVRQDDASRLTNDGAVMGTPSYMAPEQASGKSSEAGPAADQYAAGVVLYELLTGRVPFEGPAAIVIHNHVHTPPDPPSKHRAGVPKDLETICVKAIGKRPDDRYPSCRAMADDLRRWLEGEPITARRMSGRERFARWVRQNKIVAALALGVAASLAVGVVASTGFAIRASQQATRANEQAVLAASAAERADGEARAAKLAQQAAEAATRKEEAQRALTEVARTDAQNRVVRLHIRTGMAVPPGDGFAALHSYTAAWQADRDDPDRNAQHQIRLGHAILKLPNLRAVHFSPQAVNFHAFDSAEKQILSYSAAASWVRVWSASTGELNYPPLENDAPVVRAAFSGDGSRLFSLSKSGTVRVWDATTGQPVGQPLGTGVVAADISPDGASILLVGTKAAAVRRVEVGTGTLIREWTADGIVSAVRFNPAGDRIVASLPDTAVLWTSTAAQPLATVPHKAERLLVVPRITEANPFAPEYPLFSPDGRTLATLTAGGRGLAVWDGRTGVTLGPPVDFKETTAYLAFSPDGKRLLATAASSNSTHASVYDVEQKRVVCRLATERQAGPGTFSPDGTKVALRYAGADVVFHDARTGGRVGLSLRSCGRTQVPRFTKDGRSLLIADYDAISRLWDVSAAGNPLQPFSPDGGFDASLRYATADGSRYLAVTNGRLELVDGGKNSRTTLTGAAAPGRTAVAPAGDRVAVQIAGNRVQVWDAATGRPVAAAFGPTADLAWFGFAADGRFGTIADSTAQWWNASGAPDGPAVDLRAGEGDRGFVAVSPDATLAFMTRVRVPNIVDTRTGKVVSTLEGGTNAIPASAAFSSDGAWVAASWADQKVRVWRADTGKPAGPWFRGTYRSALAFSPDATLLATVTPGPQPTLTLWDWRKGESVVAETVAGPVDRIWFARNGQAVVCERPDASRSVYPLRRLPIARDEATSLVEFLTSQNFDETETITSLTTAEAAKNMSGYLAAWRKFRAPTGR